MRLLVVMAVTLTAMSAVTGCQPGASENDLSEGRAAMGYQDWQPVYRDVRPATEADLEKLRERVHGLNASSFTAALDSLGAEIASTPEHVRVRFGEGDSGEFDLHLDPERAESDDPRPFVVCFASDASCVEVGPNASSTDAPHLFNNMVDSAVFMLAGIVGAQFSLVDELSVVAATYATIDSPLGGLDCIVGGGSAEEQAGLEGQPVNLSPDPVVGVSEPAPLFPFCVDQRGLVVVVPSLLTPIAPYSSFQFGVPAGIGEHASPVPYGETPIVAPTPASTPTATETEAPGAQAPQQVLVATAIIDVGESLRAAAAAGKLSLASVPGDSVLPGALSSVAGLEDHVALLEVPMGGQITKATFGFPSMADVRALGVTPALYDAVRQVAARNGYGKSTGAAPARREMLVSVYRYVHRCQAVAGGTTTWRLEAIDDVAGDSPTYDQALRLNEYLQTSWCLRVLG